MGTVELLPIRSISDTRNSSRRSRSLRSSPTLSASIPSELPEVRVCRVSSRDSELKDCKDAPIEVFARSDVLELGIHLPSSGRSEDAVSSITTPELNSTRRSTESELVLKLMPLRRTSPHSVDSLITVESTKISFLSREVSSEPERDQLSLESQSSPLPSLGRLSRSTSNSLIPLPSTVMDVSRLLRRRIEFLGHSQASKEPNETLQHSD